MTKIKYRLYTKKELISGLQNRIVDKGIAFGNHHKILNLFNACDYNTKVSTLEDMAEYLNIDSGECNTLVAQATIEFVKLMNNPELHYILELIAIQQKTREDNTIYVSTNQGNDEKQQRQAPKVIEDNTVEERHNILEPIND